MRGNTEKDLKMITAIDLTSVSDNLSGLERMAVCLSYEMVRLRADITFVIVIKNSLPMIKKRMMPERISP